MDLVASAPSPPPRAGWVTLFHRANHRGERLGACIWVTVWRRPDLDTTAGASLAHALVEGLIGMLAPGTTVRALVLDLRYAPSIHGPATQASLGKLFRACEQAGAVLGVLHGGEALAALQLGRLVREHAPRLGQVLRDPSAAEALAQGAG